MILKSFLSVFYFLACSIVLISYWLGVLIKFLLWDPYVFSNANYRKYSIEQLVDAINSPWTE